MPRYVILEHDHPELHWDFMLEAGDVLRTWRLAQPPQAGQLVAAVASFDHRLAYLDYEGLLSGNRGKVEQWDGGEYEGLMVAGEEVKVRLWGRKLRGIVTLAPEGKLLYRPELNDER